MRGRPFKKGSPAGKKTRFTKKKRPARLKLAKSYRPKKYGVLDEAEVYLLASRGAEAADLVAALGLQAQHERVAEIVKEGNAVFLEALGRKLRDMAHDGSPRPLSEEATLWLERYGPTEGAAEEGGTVEQGMAEVKRWRADVADRAREAGLEVDAYLDSLRGGRQ